jgi:ferritin
MFNQQYNKEASNFSMYQNLANLAGTNSWRGFETFFKEYALDEITHAQKIADFIIDRNGTPYIDASPNPGVGQSDSPFDWAQTAYTKAQGYTALIKQVYEACLKEGDHEGEEFLRWYILEQVRVESVLFDLKTELARAGSVAGILEIDRRYRKD